MMKLALFVLLLPLLSDTASAVSSYAPKRAAYSKRPGKQSPASVEGLTRLLRLPAVAVTSNKPNSAIGQNNSNADKKSSKKVFTRVSRTEGLIQWVEELSLLRKQQQQSKEGDEEADDVLVAPAPALFIEMAKTLLYSGSPEQAVELYSAYYDLLVSDGTTPPTPSTPPVVPEAKMVLVAVRAHIALGDFTGALRLVSACDRNGVKFDADARSTLIHDLAESSAEGLKEALRMREAMRAMGEGRLNSAGTAGLLRGLWLHGLKPLADAKQRGSRLLMGPSHEEQALALEKSTAFRLSPKDAEQLARAIMQDWRLGLKETCSGNKAATKAATKRIDIEFLRVLFRVGQSTCKTPMSSNYDVNKRAVEEAEAMAGIKLSVSSMVEFGIGWDLGVTDMLIDECLIAGGLDASTWITVQMNVNSLYARTSTFNCVLRRYGENGDGENAFALFKEMKHSEHTSPNPESYSLLLKSFAKTKKCRFFSKEIIQSLQESKQLSKEIYDRWIELRILEDEPFMDVMELMVRDQAQPDADTILAMLNAFRRTGNWEGAMALYKLQCVAEEKRRRYRRDALSDDITDKKINKKRSREALEQLDPVASAMPPTYKAIVHCLLELLRDFGRHEEAHSVLTDMCRWSENNSRDEPSSSVLPVSLTSSSRSTLAAQYAPDGISFALVMETFVGKAGKDLTLTAEEAGQRALDVFAEMDRWGIAPDRRIFASLIKAFSLRGDIPSALGVFEEQLSQFSPDVANLQSILDACLARPETLRTLVSTLEKMAARDDLDLTVFCGDVLMQGFQDARELGSALEDMEERCEVARRRGMVVVSSSLPVISVLLQATRKSTTTASLTEALHFLGSAGIGPDSDSMTYFRIDAAPAKGDPFSSHYNQKLAPHAKKQRSLLLDLDLPEGYCEGLDCILDLPDRGPERSATAREADKEPYYEPGRPLDIFSQHAKILSKAIEGSDSDLDEDFEDDEDRAEAAMTEEERLTLAEAASAWADASADEGAANDERYTDTPAIELSEQFLMQRPPTMNRKKR